MDATVGGRVRHPARLLDAVMVALFALVVAIAGTFTLPPLDRDESRFAQATVQMLETGDFISIRFQDDERNKKPVGIYWMQAASVTAFSSAEAREIWAYRIPSVLGVIFAAVFTYLAGARIYGAAVGLLGALILAASPGAAAEATIAKTDAMLLASVCAAQCALLHVYAGWEENRPRGLLWPLIFWVAIGVGLLLKGPITPMIAGLTGAGLLIRTKKPDWVWRLRPLFGVVLAALIVAPWAIAIGVATEGRFYAEALGGDMLGKVGTAQESHSGPPGYHLLLVWILLWPAAALLIPGVVRTWSTRAAWPSWFLLCWIVPSWIVFEITATKLPHYTLPLYPALSIMAARAALGAASHRRKQARRFGAAVYTAVGLGVAVAVALLPNIFSDAAVRAACYLTAALVAGGTFAVGWLFLIGRARGAIGGAIALSAFIAWTLLGGVLPSLEQLKISPRLSRALEHAELHPVHDGAPPVAIAGFYEPSAVFLLGTQTELTDGVGAAAHLSAYPGSAVAIDMLERDAFKAAIAANDISVSPLGEVAGLNYSKGREIRLTIYTADKKP